MKTGGGVTFSGGEPLLQAKNLLPVIRACKEQQIHVAIETASYVTWENMENLLPYVDLWICDIKAISASLFKEGCGQNIDVICENLKRLSACQGAKMWIRVPLITNFNDTKAELGKIRKFIDSLGNSVERGEILPYHDIGKTKYYATVSYTHLDVYKRQVGGIPVPVIIAVIVVIFGFFILKKTILGRYIYAIGGNEQAVAFSGVNVKARKVIIYTLSGVLTAIAGCILIARMNSGQPSAADGAETDIIASVVIGGTSLC